MFFKKYKMVVQPAETGAAEVEATGEAETGTADRALVLDGNHNKWPRPN